MSSGIGAVKEVFKASTAKCDEEETQWDGEVFCLMSVSGVGVSG